MDLSWEGFKDFLKSGLGVLAVIFGLFLIGLVGFRVLFVNFIDNYEIAYKYDLRTGKIEILNERGYIVTPPFLVKVHHIDLRPMQVCINANQRVLNCKLVQFQPEGFDLFLSWHGRNNYDGPGNVSSNSQNTSTTTTFSEILKSYAYEESGRTYPFLKIVTVLKPEGPGWSVPK